MKKFVVMVKTVSVVVSVVADCRVLRQGPGEEVCGDGEDCECCGVCGCRQQGSTPRTR